MMSPALVHGGTSFLGGFLVGWAFRKTLKIALLITISLAALVAILKSTGWIHLEWSLIQSDVNRTLDWARGQAQSLQEVAVGYLPSAGTGVAEASFWITEEV